MTIDMMELPIHEHDFRMLVTDKEYNTKRGVYLSYFMYCTGCLEVRHLSFEVYQDEPPTPKNWRVQ